MDTVHKKMKNAYTDREFFDSIAHKPWYEITEELEKYLESAYKRLQKGETVHLFFDEYEIALSKYSFIIKKEGKTLIDNYLEGITYNDFNDIVFNPYTNKSVHIHAPKAVYDFLQKYLLIRNKRATMRNSADVTRTNSLTLFTSHMALSILYLIILFGVMAGLWYADAKCFESISQGRMVLEGILSLVVAEFVYDFIKTRLM